MTREEALDRIHSDDSEMRLAAARYFSVGARVEDLPLLRELEQAESVPWVQRALRIACEKHSAPEALGADTGAKIDDADVLASIHSKVMRDVSSRILHEIAPLIGGLLASAPGEVVDYAASQTKRLIEQLSARSEALRNMRTATATSNFEELDLASVVADLIAAQPDVDGIQVILAGPEKFLVSADRVQLSMALSNGLRNAFEAVREAALPKPQLVLSWGRTQHENWLFVKDNGRGLRHAAADLLKDGISSKPGHSGYGLSLAREAMISMQGEVLLRNDEGGAHFELRWYRKNEDPVR